MKLKEGKAEIKGISAEFIKIDEETGELCVGDDCLRVKYEASGNVVAVEFDPNAQSCNPLMRKVAKMFLKQIADKRPKVKFREIRRFDDE